MASNQSTAYSCGIELELFIKPRTEFVEQLENMYGYIDEHHPADNFFRTGGFRGRETNRRALHEFLTAALVMYGVDAVLQVLMSDPPPKDYSKWHIEDDPSIAEAGQDPELSRFCMQRPPASWTNADQFLP